MTGLSWLKGDLADISEGNVDPELPGVELVSDSVVAHEKVNVPCHISEGHLLERPCRHKVWINI